MNDCQDCKGTGLYVGLIDREPCRTCQSFTPSDAKREAIKQAEHWATPEFTKVHSRGCGCKECIPWFHDKKDHVTGHGAPEYVPESETERIQLEESFARVQHGVGCCCKCCLPPWLHRVTNNERARLQHKKDYVAGLKERGLVTDDLHVGRDGNIKAHPPAEPCPARFMLGSRYSECASCHYEKAQAERMRESLRVGCRICKGKTNECWVCQVKLARDEENKRILDVKAAVHFKV